MLQLTIKVIHDWRWLKFIRDWLRDLLQSISSKNDKNILFFAIMLRAGSEEALCDKVSHGIVTKEISNRLVVIAD